MFNKIRKIRTKILLPALLMLFLALFVTSSISAYLSYISTLNTLEKTMTQTITAASDRVSAEMSRYKTLLTELSGSVQKVEPENVMEYVSEAKERHGFSNISITLPDGVVGGSRVDVSGYDFYTVPRDSGAAYVSDPIPSPDGKSMTVYVSAPILTDGRFDGVIFVEIDAKMLSNIASSIQIGQTGTTTIIDKTGTTIAYYDYPTVLAKYRTQDEEKSDPKLARLAALEREAMSGKPGFGAYSYNGKEKLMAYAPIANSNGWSMYSTVEKSEFLQGTYTATFVSIACAVIFLVLSSIILIAIVSSISRPIVALQKAAVQMANGNYDIDVTHHSKDEIGSLADSMRQMLASTKSIIMDTSRGLNQIAHGNFDVAPGVPYIGVFSGIELAMKKIITDLSDTMRQIQISTDQVASGSDQVASGAQALAQGATQQASSVQELSASINEVSDKIRTNATNAAAVNQLATNAADGLGLSSQQMKAMIKAMSDINKSSEEIGKIIKTIEDIAFQTNILALNAAVEAARAGAAGKGFAVVADEVRNLANKSSEAAKQTNILIENSVKAVGRGVKIADYTAKSLEGVVQQAGEMASLIGEISEASEDQSSSIAQINLGVEQISAVVQTNSATSEQSAAASEELSSQAVVMKELVGRFRLLDENHAAYIGTDDFVKIK